MLDIAGIQVLFASGKVFFTQHFLYRIDERSISLTDIESAIYNGEIIEQYPDDTPHPSVLLLGNILHSPLHVVIGMGEDMAWLVTAYHPDLRKWEDNLKTRKAGNK